VLKNVDTSPKYKLQKLIDCLEKKYGNNTEFFKQLRLNEFSTIEIMIVDSILKEFPLEALPNLLLIRQDRFDEVVSDLNDKLDNLLQNIKKSPIKKTSIFSKLFNFKDLAV
jgi:hypothetical protein